MLYPAFVDGKPPVVSLAEYDAAEWADTTCVDRRDGGYVAVVMEKPEQVVAAFEPAATATLDIIFRSAHDKLNSGEAVKQ